MSHTPRATPSVGQTITMVGDRYTFRATSAETGGAYVLLDSTVPPGGGPPTHIHTRETEVFVVIEGHLTCTEEGVTRTLGPGESITLLPHKAHTFRNNGDKPVRMLIICLPAGIEKMFAEAGTLIDGAASAKSAQPPTPAEIEQLTAAATRAGISFVPHP